MFANSLVWTLGCVLVSLILVSCIMFSFLRKRTYRFRQKSLPTIFVMCPCYRDDQCTPTLDSIFENAEFPGRVVVGACVQNKDGDAECPGKKYNNNENVRTISLSYKLAKGPCYARFLISTLYRDEDYVLSCDCHTQLVKNWDTLCIQMLNECHRPKKSVLTSHPPKKTDKPPSTDRTTHICNGKFNGDTVAFSSIEVAAQSKNMPTYFVGWGFIFMYGITLKKVPLDPDLDFLFEGEELLYALRLWTHGYDCYSPRSFPCTHLYERTKQPSVYVDVENWSTKQQGAIKKVSNALKGKSFKCCGLGKKRTVKEFLEKAQIDLSTKTIKGHCIQ